MDACSRAAPPDCAIAARWPRRTWPHSAAAFAGSALLARVYALGWARRAKDSRVVQFTEQGEHAFRQLFKGSAKELHAK